MMIRSDHTNKTIRALRQRHALLAAFLEAANRIDGKRPDDHDPETVIAFVPRRLGAIGLKAER
jgi:hypothetical protein